MDKWIKVLLEKHRKVRTLNKGGMEGWKKVASLSPLAMSLSTCHSWHVTLSGMPHSRANYKSFKYFIINDVIKGGAKISLNTTAGIWCKKCDLVCIIRFQNKKKQGKFRKMFLLKKANFSKKKSKPIKLPWSWKLSQVN